MEINPKTFRLPPLWRLTILANALLELQLQIFSLAPHLHQSIHMYSNTNIMFLPYCCKHRNFLTTTLRQKCFGGLQDCMKAYRIRLWFVLDSEGGERVNWFSGITGKQFLINVTKRLFSWTPIEFGYIKYELKGGEVEYFMCSGLFFSVQIGMSCILL